MIKVTNASKHFGTFTALNNMNTEIAEGSIYGLIGSNGAGKSTFLRMITGIYQAEGGKVEIDGENVWNNPEAKKKFLYVPDELFFLPSADMNRMAKLYSDYYPNFDYERYGILTERFGLNPKANIATFSKGMKRQAATVLALSCKPQYLFFDETFDGLDPVMRKLVKDEIIEDVKQRKITAVITSHSLRELEDVCNQLTLLHKGGVIFESDVQNLKTALFKIQIAFDEDYDETKFEGIEMLDFSKKGRVSNFIVRGEREVILPKLEAMQPLLMDLLPLSLEEVFVYEMEALGYAFKDVMM